MIAIIHPQTLTFTRFHINTLFLRERLKIGRRGIICNNSNPLFEKFSLNIRISQKFTRARVITSGRGLTPAIAGCTYFTVFNRLLLPQFLARFANAHLRSKIGSSNLPERSTSSLISFARNPLRRIHDHGGQASSFSLSFDSDSRRALAAPKQPFSRRRSVGFLRAWTLTNRLAAFAFFASLGLSKKTKYPVLFLLHKCALKKYVSGYQNTQGIRWRILSLLSHGCSKFAQINRSFWTRFVKAFHVLVEGFHSRKSSQSKLVLIVLTLAWPLAFFAIKKGRFFHINRIVRYGN